jgi:hypothetical protein
MYRAVGAPLCRGSCVVRLTDLERLLVRRLLLAVASFSHTCDEAPCQATWCYITALAPGVTIGWQRGRSVLLHRVPME